MSKAKRIHRLKVGDKVRVRSGVSDPEYDDLTIGGCTGTIAELQDGTPPIVLVRWSKQTLKAQSPIYRKRCERDGFDSNEMWLAEADLEPDRGGPVTIEPSENVVTRPLSMSDQDDRIRAVFGLTSDDPLPEADDESVVTYFKFLAAKLSFPFEAQYSFETGLLQSTTWSITAVGLLDPDDFPTEEYGLFCEARRGRRGVELPLAELEVGKGDPNRQLVDDYSYWFANW